LPDLTTEFKAYITTLKTAAPSALDVNTLIVKHLPTVRAGAPTQVDDANTMYSVYIT
jgi:hypothetical protein